MLKLNSVLLILSIMILFVVGCSGAGDNVSPSFPDSTGNLNPVHEGETQHVIWGLWDLHFDVNALTVEVVSARSIQGHFDVTDMIIPPACDDCLEISVNSFDLVTRIVDADVTLRNPYGISGRDVRGILFTNDAGHELRNADDWTKLFDIPGGGTLNPFKAFAKAETNRVFTGMGEHMENYLVYIPIPPQYTSIKYAVTASWPSNCKEPYSIQNFTQTPLHDETGVEAVLMVDVLDWQDDVTEVTLVAPEITGVGFSKFQHYDGSTWRLAIENVTGAVAGDYNLRIIATSANSEDTALYDYVDVTVSESTSTGWVRTWGGTGEDDGYNVAVDSAGNAYVGGFFSDTVDFDPGLGVVEKTSGITGDSYLSKFSLTGDFIWVCAWGSDESDDIAGLVLDDSDNLYIAGYHEGTVDFDPGTGVNEVDVIGDASAYLLKLDSDGNFQWVRTWGGIDWDECYGAVVSNTGDVYAAGLFLETVDFDPGTGVDEHVSAGGEDAFLVKYNSAGDFQWARTWGGTSNDQCRDITIDGTGNVYLTGRFRGTVDFDPGVGTDEKTPVGSDDCFMSKYDSTGSYQWTKTWGGTEYDAGYCIKADSFYNVYAVGIFNDTVDLDPGDGSDPHTTNGNNDIFLSKFNTDGEFQWGLSWGGAEWDNALNVSVDGSGDIYVTGNYEATVDFDPGSGVDEHTALFGIDAFLSKFKPNGDYLWGRTWGGTTWGWDQGYCTATDDAGDVYFTGWFQTTVDFDPGDGTEEHTSNGNDDAFLLKLRPDGYW